MSFLSYVTVSAIQRTVNWHHKRLSGDDRIARNFVSPRGDRRRRAFIEPPTPTPPTIKKKSPAQSMPSSPTHDSCTRERFAPSLEPR